MIAQADTRVHALVTSALHEAHRAAEAVRCAACGDLTDTHDGYDVETPLGEVWVCPACNLNPKLWDAAEVFFTGAVAPAPTNERRI